MSDEDNWPLIRVVISSLAVEILYQLSTMIIQLLDRQVVVMTLSVSS